MLECRAYRIDHLNGLDGLRLHTETVAEPQRGEVLVRIRAVALNFRDIAPALGRYVWDAKPGLIPCSDAAGEVIAVGERVTDFRVGDRVISTFHPRWFGGRPQVSAFLETYGNAQDGWLRELKTVSQEALLPLPSYLSDEESTTLPCAALTAWNALTGSKAVAPRDIVLTQGTGGVSQFALQFTKALGAKVIATTTNAEKFQVLKSFGADEMVDTSQTTQWGEHVKATLTRGEGVDRVVEVVGPATFVQSLQAVRWGGEVVVIGFLSQAREPIDYFALKRFMNAATLKPALDRLFDFAHTAAAFDHLHAGARAGKIVIKVS